MARLLDRRGHRRAALDAHTPAHDARLLWYTRVEAEAVWDAWIAAEQHHAQEPTEANRQLALDARHNKTAFYDHVVALRRVDGDLTEALRRCAIFTGVAEYCGEMPPDPRTHNGW